MEKLTRNPLVTLFWLLVIGGFINYLLTLSNVTEKTEQEMKEAHEAYVKGEKASTVPERNEAFNKALKLYASFDTEYQPTLGDGILYYNIANSNFQLGEYPLAVLYYNRALKLMPRNEKAQHNLKVTLDKLGIVEKKEESIFGKIFFFNHYFSLPEKLQMLFAFSLIALFFASSYIWQQLKWMRQLAIAAALVVFIIFLSLGYYLYIEPIEAVIIKSSPLYRDAGFQYAKVTEEPILSGKKVEVLDVLYEGEWLKIFTPDGKLGYVPSQAIRII